MVYLSLVTFESPAVFVKESKTSAIRKNSFKNVLQWYLLIELALICSSWLTLSNGFSPQYQDNHGNRVSSGTVSGYSGWLVPSIECTNYPIKQYKKTQFFPSNPRTVLCGSRRSNYDVGKSSSASFSQKQKVHLQNVRNQGEWIPRQLADDDIFGSDREVNLERKAVQLAALLVRERLRLLKDEEHYDECSVDWGDDDSITTTTSEVVTIVKGRFMDLACTEKGERILENLFLSPSSQCIVEKYSTDEIRGVVMVLQSLCVMGTQVGVKGPPEQLKRKVAHLQDDRVNDPFYVQRDLYECWDHDSVRRLKYRLDRNPAIDLLTALQRKRVNQGAFDLLVDLGAWSIHEDLPLLRSGFPLRFTKEEEIAALEASRLYESHDPDQLLGLRQDFRDMKVYTIDGESTSEIDDGLSIEKLMDEKYRIWVHIADADRWAPRNSSLWEIARRRITSIYLPSGPISMFPASVSQDLMSLKANCDVCALSLGAVLNEDGSIDLSSIVVTPSVINVDYRLTYDEVDEMLEEGIAYNEEWQLGALLDAAIKRRQYRIKNGSSEGIVQNPIPYSSISLAHDINQPDEIRIDFSIQVSHNAARNKTAVAEETTNSGNIDNALTSSEDPLSSAYLMVTEAMILAGEAIGLWSHGDGKKIDSSNFSNQLRLPFRTQVQPEYKGREKERNVLSELFDENTGGGFCHAWYMRRFLQSVRVQEEQMPHSGLGLKSYVQWSSPIRRFSDLQVHASVKRYLRRCKIYEMLQANLTIPQGISASDLGISPQVFSSDSDSFVLAKSEIGVDDLDSDVNFFDGIGLVGAAKTLQRQSQQYWILEHVRRLKLADPTKVYTSVVLGCIDPERQQYSMYLFDLGFEHRYISPIGRLEPGTMLRLKVDNVNPRADLLNFVRVV